MVVVDDEMDGGCDGAEETDGDCDVVCVGADVDDGFVSGDVDVGFVTTDAPNGVVVFVEEEGLVSRLRPPLETFAVGTTAVVDDVVGCGMGGGGGSDVVDAADGDSYFRSTDDSDRL